MCVGVWNHQIVNYSICMSDLDGLQKGYMIYTSSDRIPYVQSVVFLSSLHKSAVGGYKRLGEGDGPKSRCDVCSRYVLGLLSYLC